MSSTDEIANDNPDNNPEARPVHSHWQRKAKFKLPADAAARQGSITRLAFERLGSRDAAIAYLNSHCAKLGGRPLDIATATKEGWQAIKLDITALS
jgi:hypothetical protein